MPRKTQEGRNTYAREYYKKHKDTILEQHRIKRQTKKQIIDEYKSEHGCGKCGDLRPYVLDFHHKNGKEKEENVSDMVRKGHSLETLQNEIGKCIVLCANCHRELHYLEKLNN